MDDPHPPATARRHRTFQRRRKRHLTIALALVLSCASAACDLDSVSGTDTGTDTGVFYALGDDHRLYRWDPGTDQSAVEPVLDLSGVWDGEGDVGSVLRSSLSIDPRQRHAAWITGGTPEAALNFGNLDTGEIATAVEYPVDHACIDPAWLPDGSAVLAHRAPVWGADTDPDTRADTDEIPFPVQAWGATEWYSPDAGQLPTTLTLEPQGCRLRWYTSEDGSVQAIYHDLEFTELYRIDVNGQLLETIQVSGLQGAEPVIIGLVDVDPTGRYACVVDNYGPYGASKGGFTIRAESGTRVVDLASGAAVGPEGSGCNTLHDEGFVSRDGPSVSFIGYDGESQWDTELPAQVAESPVLYFFPDGS
ncbi:hypothetical protein [Glycomyces rhizosphaerae]|uniref:Uncharacterized protein n=1 Tax=Glycomyces rhizosphaerae TaxID=2054422 RepID=A0ABV7PZ92_9ACTN